MIEDFPHDQIAARPYTPLPDLTAALTDLAACMADQLAEGRGQWLNACCRKVDPRDIPHVIQTQDQHGTTTLTLRGRVLGTFAPFPSFSAHHVDPAQRVMFHAVVMP